MVVGYIPPGEKTPLGLVLASWDDFQRRITYRGVVERGISKKQYDDLLRRLKKLTIPRPVFEGMPVTAIWVKPEIFCEIHQSGADSKGELINPNFGSFLE